MTVQQLMALLSGLPPEAPVLLEDDGGLSPLGGVALMPDAGGRPGEVLLQPDMTPD